MTNDRYSCISFLLIQFPFFKISLTLIRTILIQSQMTLITWIRLDPDSSTHSHPDDTNNMDTA